jgi:hypothetical protein
MIPHSNEHMDIQHTDNRPKLLDETMATSEQHTNLTETTYAISHAGTRHIVRSETDPPASK